ncbi:MAG: hypothetical protein K2W94_04820 [Alphaproteobacteria bacterium]|nr:hypothetical protein [Alphaproteobacteria bacterium]
MSKSQLSPIQSDKRFLTLKFVNNEVFFENKKILPRQAYKRREILHILLTQALKDRCMGSRYPTLLSIEDLAELLNLPSNYDREIHLLRPIRSLSQQLGGELVSQKARYTTLFFLDLENIKIEID